MSRNDALVQCSIRSTELATLALCMHEHGIKMSSMSEMLRIALESYVKILVDKVGAQRIERTMEATEILKSLFKVKLNPGGRFEASLIKNIEEEEAAGIEFVPFHTENSTVSKIIASRSNLTEKYKRIAGETLGIEVEEPEPTEEERSNKEEAIRNAQAQSEASMKAEILTPLQIERGKAIIAATVSKVEKYQKLAVESKTHKDRETYRQKIQLVAKFSERAKTDDEAFRILVDEL